MEGDDHCDERNSTPPPLSLQRAGIGGTAADTTAAVAEAASAQEAVAAVFPPQEPLQSIEGSEPYGVVTEQLQRQRRFGGHSECGGGTRR